MYRIFVYGTLKRNQPNYSVMEELSASVRFIGEAKTVEKLPLVIATDLKVPFLLHQPGKGHSIRGEIYDVNESALEVLDVFELRGIIYEREEIRVRLAGSQEETSACAYVYKTPGKRVLELPYLENYDNVEMTKIGNGYVERSERTKTLADVAHQLLN